MVGVAGVVGRTEVDALSHFRVEEGPSLSVTVFGTDQNFCLNCGRGVWFGLCLLHDRYRHLTVSRRVT